MRPHWPPRGVLLPAAIVLLLPAAPALAARAPALVWPGPEVAAGQVVELSWSEVPAGIEELEILLSLDDGRSFRIRVSPELSACERRYLWRVPDLPVASARLRIRLGSEHAEIETVPTAPFRIVGSDAAPAPRHLVLEGPLWTGCEPLDSGDRGMLSPAARMDANDPTAAALEAPPRLTLPPPAPGSPALMRGDVSSGDTARPAIAYCPPRLTPLLN